MNNHKIIMPSGGGGGTPSRIQNDGNTQFVDTASSNVSIDLRPSLSQNGGSETGRIKLARNFFELYAERIHTNPNFKHKYQIITKDNGGIDIIVTDTDFSLLGEPSRDNTYSFDYAGLDNPNQVARMKELDTKVDKVEGKELSENNYTNSDKQKVDKLKIDGDGTKYLSDDGEYKIVEAGIEEAPIDNKVYARKDSAWVETLTKTEIESELQDAVDTIADMLGVL